MNLFRWSLMAAIVYGTYRSIVSQALEGGMRGLKGPEDDPAVDGAASSNKAVGLAGTFSTREAADLAVEHLVQKHGLDRAAIFVEAVGQENSVGTDLSGGDALTVGEPARSDAPLRGALRVTIAGTGKDQAILHQALVEAGADQVRAI